MDLATSVSLYGCGAFSPWLASLVRSWSLPNEPLQLVNRYGRPSASRALVAAQAKGKSLNRGLWKPFSARWLMASQHWWDFPRSQALQAIVGSWRRYFWPVRPKQVTAARPTIGTPSAPL